jgi:two-component system sensor kinase FixL
LRDALRLDQGGMTDCVLEIPDVDLAEQRLRLSQFSVEHAADAIFWVARDARIIYANEQAVRSLGHSRDELLTMRVHDFDLLYPPENWDQAWRDLRERGLLAVESIHRRRDGSEFPVWVHASYYNDGHEELSFACCRDLTEKRATEQALRRANDELELRVSQRTAELAHVARLATTGEMAAAIAHELNQPLYAVHNFAQGALRRLEAGSLDRESLLSVLREIAHESQRAADVIRSMRRYVAKREPQRAAADANELVQTVMRLLAAEAVRRQCAIDVRLADALPFVLCDPIQIKQVLVNLILNGMEAMRDSPPAERKICVCSEQVDEGRVRLSVCDQGMGLPNGDAERVFDAFFTTKEDGVGLGLKISRTIVESHGARLDVRPNVDRGVTFRFELPVI